jgi:hypothetical protein
VVERNDLQASERRNESRHERECVQDVASIGDALLVDDLKVGVVVSVPTAVSGEMISKHNMCPKGLIKLTRSTGT